MKLYCTSHASVVQQYFGYKWTALFLELTRSPQQHPWRKLLVISSCNRVPQNESACQCKHHVGTMASEMKNTPSRMEDRHPHMINKDDDLRKVEVDVLIPKMMKQSAMKACSDVVQEFTECCRGRTVSILFHCRDVNNRMDACLRANMTDADFLREKTAYLQKRDEFNRKQSEMGTVGAPKTNEKMVAM
eukprot:m.266378 g.266378  ORF g.266378 m.266378 type:complete len:189 (-) comp19720_c1_seq16:4088-4654(-)